MQCTILDSIYYIITKGDSDQVQFLHLEVKQSCGLFQPESRNSKAKLFSQGIIRAKHIHSNDFDATSDGSIIFKKVITNDSLCSTHKNSDDVEIIEILCNKTHLSLSEGILVPGHNLRKLAKVMLKAKVIELANDS